MIFSTNYKILLTGLLQLYLERPNMKEGVLCVFLLLSVSQNDGCVWDNT